MKNTTPGLELNATAATTQVIHVPTGAPRSIIMETREYAAAIRVVASLARSGVDWTQPHGRENHAAMRDAVRAATADGDVKTAYLDLPGIGQHVKLIAPHPYAGRIGFVLRSGDFDGGLQGPIVGGLLVDAGLAGPVVVRAGQFERVTAIPPGPGDAELVRVSFVG